MGRGASGYNPQKPLGSVWCDNLGESRIASSELFLLMESLPHRKRSRGESVGGGRNEDGEHGDRGSTAMPCARSWWSCGRRPNGSAASVVNRCCALWWKAWNGMAIGLAEDVRCGLLSMSTNTGSDDSLKVSTRCGYTPKACQMRWIADGA